MSDEIRYKNNTKTNNVQLHIMVQLGLKAETIALIVMLALVFGAVIWLILAHYCKGRLRREAQSPAAYIEVGSQLGNKDFRLYHKRVTPSSILVAISLDEKDYEEEMLAVDGEFARAVQLASQTQLGQTDKPFSDLKETQDQQESASPFVPLLENVETDGPVSDIDTTRVRKWDEYTKEVSWSMDKGPEKLFDSLDIPRSIQFQEEQNILHNNEQFSTRLYIQNVLHRWIEISSPNNTLARLCKALKISGSGKIAEILKQKFKHNVRNIEQT